MDGSGPRHRQTERIGDQQDHAAHGHDGFSTHSTHVGGPRGPPKLSQPKVFRMPRSSKPERHQRLHPESPTKKIGHGAPPKPPRLYLPPYDK
ncbi:hypothetical protein MTO96_028888 [Rhipicephalus appendiculatus]